MNESYITEQRLATLEQRAVDADDRTAEIHRRLDKLETALFGNPTELAEWREVEQQSTAPRQTEPDPGIAERLRRVAEKLDRWPDSPDGFVHDGILNSLSYGGGPLYDRLIYLLEKSEAAKRVVHAAIDSRIDRIAEQDNAESQEDAEVEDRRGRQSAEICQRLRNVETALFGDADALSEYQRLRAQSTCPLPPEPDRGVVERLRRACDKLTHFEDWHRHNPEGFIKDGLIQALKWSQTIRGIIEEISRSVAERLVDAAIDSGIDRIAEQVLARLPAPAKKKKKRGGR